MRLEWSVTGEQLRTIVVRRMIYIADCRLRRTRSSVPLIESVAIGIYVLAPIASPSFVRTHNVTRYPVKAKII